MVHFRSLAGAALLLLCVVLAGSAQNLRITIPKRSKPTPVQKYNQEGVDALKKHKIDSAKKALYKAYLLDPNDPFTLNNLGYVAELEGEVDRATRYYDLASANSSEATITKSTTKEVEGKPVSLVAGRNETGPLQVNRLNVQAISLMQRDRALEAETILQRALKVDPNNPFTLNNLGFAREKEGEYESALGYYRLAAQSSSNEKIVVTIAENRNWRGKKISEVASQNAKKMEAALAGGQSVEARVARLNLRGVTALNKNDRSAARGFFQQANQLDPTNAFTLNNMGYLAELDGDKETASFYYEKAQSADGAQARVGVATRRDAEGRPLEGVADNSQSALDIKMETEQAERRRQQANQPVTLKQRNTPPDQNPEPKKPQ